MGILNFIFGNKQKRKTRIKIKIPKKTRNLGNGNWESFNYNKIHHKTFHEISPEINGKKVKYWIQVRSGDNFDNFLPIFEKK
jgi:hypothetical protein